MRREFVNCFMVLSVMATAWGCGENARSSDGIKKADTLSPAAMAIQRDTTYDVYVPDTSKRFAEFSELLAYKSSVDKRFFDYRKKRLADDPNNGTLEYQLDSVGWLIQDWFTNMIFEQLHRSKKTKDNIMLLGFNAGASRSVTTEERLRLFAEYPTLAQESPAGKTALSQIKKFETTENVGGDLGAIKNIMVQDSTGRSLPFAQSINNGAEYTLLIFTASWCGPCRYEAAFLNRELIKFDTANFKMVSISIENKRDKWLRFIRKDANPWPQFFHPGEMESPLARSIVFSSLPLNLLLDKNKKVLAQNVDVKKILDKWPQLYKKG